MSEELEIILQLKKWNESIVRQLKMIVDADKDTNFLVEGKEGEKVEVKKEDRYGVRLGVILALGMIDPFPVSISENESDESE